MTVKKFIPDVSNNVCSVDSNGTIAIMKCCDMDECLYYCTRFNKGEEYVNYKDRDKHDRAGRQDSH